MCPMRRTILAIPVSSHLDKNKQKNGKDDVNQAHHSKTIDALCGICQAASICCKRYVNFYKPLIICIKHVWIVWWLYLTP